MKKIANFIDGIFCPPSSQKYLDNYNPATGETYSLIPDSEMPDIENAVMAAQKAFPEWASLPTRERATYLRRIAALIEEHSQQLAELESIDNGKPLSLAKSVDIPRSADNFRFFASAIEQFSSEAHPMGTQAINYTLHQPLGVTGCISPWNLPLYLFTWKIAPALATGNCVVAKPSEITPMTAYCLAEFCQTAELPPGVLNIVHGDGPKAGASLTAHSQIKAISFTGSVKTGREIAQLAAPSFKKICLEMGGKNPNIIFADCNYEAMLETTIRASFSNQGQICLCSSRIFIEQPLYEKFKQDFIARTRKLRVGDPLEPDNNLGAVVSKAHWHKIISYIKLARQEGGSILCGGEAIALKGRCAKGWFIEPTVIEGLSYDCRTNQEEIFGPVVTLTPFKEESEVLHYANSTQYGLAAVVWTENLQRAHHLSAQLDAGIVWINCWMLRDLRTPFGGIKNSGSGREGGWEALRFFTEPKNICINIE